MDHNGHFVKRIRKWRSTKRDRMTGECLYNVEWSDGTTEYDKPMSEFFDEKWYNSYMYENICDFLRTAAKYPKKNRQCLTCDRKVKNGNIFCKSKSGVGKCNNLRYRFSDLVGVI